MRHSQTDTHRTPEEGAEEARRRSNDDEHPDRTHGRHKTDYDDDDDASEFTIATWNVAKSRPHEALPQL